ncbi:M67 family metallopeptidase [Thermococcus henrietii]|uniref:M67 family metallopeptidase n=1 Tax=Thermococcus henrietii TaxID=2016361 RepID=UPI000C08D710|nr:M67 family metallopeptidase [Thermococcus henrietii]
MRLIIRREIIKMLIEMAKNANVEVCGFLLGQKESLNEINLSVIEARQIRNRLNSPNAFGMEPEEMVRVLDEAETRGLEVVGIFHSHLKCPPVLSERDLEGMKNWPVVWLIVTPEGEVRAWVLGKGGVEEVEIIDEANNVREGGRTRNSENGDLRHSHRGTR